MAIDVKTFLSGIKAELGIIEAMNEEENLLCANLLPRAITYDGSKVQVSPSDRTADIMAQVVDLEQQRDVVRKRLLKDVSLAQELLDQMPTKEYSLLLRLRYLDGKGPYTRWQDIGYQMGYAEKYVRCRLHGQALNEAQNIWEKMWQKVTLSCDSI